MSTRRGVEATSLVTKRDEVLIEGGDSDGDVEIDLDFTPAKRVGTQSPARGTSSPQSAVKLQRNAAGDLVSPRGGRPWLKSTHSAGSKARGKASETAPRKERHFAMIEADEERLERALTTNAGVAAGERMYYLAMKRRQRSVSQQQSDAGKSPTADKECTFHPSLSSGTVRLIEDTGGYRPPCERFDAQELRLAKARLMQQHANQQTTSIDCTFTPLVDSVSQALVKRSRSVSRSRSEERCAGPRLFDEGMKRLQHQKFMATQIKLMEDEERVGGLLRLGKGDADAVSRRLHKWQQQKDHDIELLRHEEVLSWRPQRSRSCDDQAFFNRLYAPPVAESPKRPPSAASPGKVAGSGRKRVGHNDPNTASPERLHVSDRSRLLASELQKIRFRALFAKYAPSAATDGTVTVELVRDQVKKLFPHDSGVADALSHFKLGEPISRNAFVAALCAYERRYGPQRWGRMEHHRLHEEDSDDDLHGATSGRPRRAGRPQISAHTQELVAHRGRSGKPIFEQLLERGKESEKRKHERQQEVIKEQSKELTFWPAITGGGKNTTSARGATHRQRSSSAPRTPTTPVTSVWRGGGGSLNVSLEHSDAGVRSTPNHATQRHHPRNGVWRDTASNCDEVDDLLRSIDEQLLTAVAPPGASTVPSRCSAPISPLRGEDAFNRLDLSHLQPPRPDRPSASALPQAASHIRSMDAVLNTRSPLRHVDWNQSAGSRSVLTTGGGLLRTPPSTKTPLRGSSSTTPSPRPQRTVPSFAADADSMLDHIYCDVSIEKRYSHVQQQWSPPARRGATRGGARATTKTEATRPSQTLKENRAIVVEGRSRKAFR
jgi:hypothetical protein